MLPHVSNAQVEMGGSRFKRQDTRRTWAAPAALCAGSCNTNGFYSLCVSCWCPCFAFGCVIFGCTARLGL